MKLYVQIGFPRTGSTFLQVHFFPNHPQINYLGRYPKTKPQFELIDLISYLNNDDFDKRYNELLKKAEEFNLDPNKTNVISSEHIILSAIHNPNNNDNFRTISRTISRINSLFSKRHVDVYFFCFIRSQAKIIRSLYMAAAPELNRSMTFSGEEII